MQLKRKLQSIQGAGHPMTTAPQYMGVNHRGGDIGVPQEFLDGPDIMAAFQQMGSKTVAQGMTVDPLRH